MKRRLGKGSTAQRGQYGGAIDLDKYKPLPKPNDKQTPLRCKSCGSRRGMTLWCTAYTGSDPCCHGEKQDHIVKICGCCGAKWSEGNPLEK